MKTNHWKFAIGHAWLSLKGLCRIMLQHPFFALHLLWVRARFFFTRGLRHPVSTPDGFLIETAGELISYWSFFVEREGCAGEWLDGLAGETKPLVLDVGANAGLFTHLIWTLKPSAEIVSFEPLPKMAAKIKAWQARTSANLTIHNRAVSDHCGTASFFALADNDTGASLKATDRSKGEPLSVPVITLDSVVQGRQIFMIKIDVEGAEPEVLAGAQQTLITTKYLIIEAHTEEALSKIREKLGSRWQCKRVGGSDYLFRQQAG